MERTIGPEGATVVRFTTRRFCLIQARAFCRKPRLVLMMPHQNVTVSKHECVIMEFLFNTDLGVSLLQRASKAESHGPLARTSSSPNAGV